MHSGSSLKIGGMIESPNICLVRLLGMPDRAGAAATAVRLFGDAGINIEFISESADAGGTANIALAISMTDLDRFEEHMAIVKRDTAASTLAVSSHCALVGLHGPQFGEIPGVASSFFSAMGKAGINILAIASSLSSLCCVVHEGDRQGARRALLAVFGHNGR